MSSANGLRGEVCVLLAGQERRLRPTFARLVDAEAEAGSLMAMVDRAAGGDVRLADIEALVWHCLDKDDDERRDGVRDRLLEGGLTPLLGPFRALLAAALGGR